MRATLVEKDLGPPAQSEAERLDPAEFGLLYEQHRLSVYRYLRARTHNDADALDLAAETFERAFTGLNRFRRRDGARNAAIDAHRRHRPTVDLAGADAHLGRVALEADRRDQASVEILDLVGRLPSDQQDALLLRYAGGLTAKEIGFVIGKREGAVQKQIERGLAALREAF